MKNTKISIRVAACVVLVMLCILLTIEKNIYKEQNKVQREMIDHLQHTCDSLVLNAYVKELKVKK